MSLLIIAGVAGCLIAILPAFLIFLYIARFKGRFWLSALLGGIFWFIALLARTPILAIIEFVVLIVPLELLLVYTAIVIFTASLLAGLFEEGIKYFFLKRTRRFIETTKHALSFGLGWGLGEAFLIYVLDVLVYAFFYPLLIIFTPLPPEEILAINFLIGAVERNLAIIFHVSATILVALAIWHGKRMLLWVAIFAHFLFDFVPILLYQFVFIPLLGPTFIPVVLTEALFAVWGIVFAILAFYEWKWLGGPPTPKLETQLT